MGAVRRRRLGIVHGLANGVAVQSPRVIAAGQTNTLPAKPSLDLARRVGLPADRFAEFRPVRRPALHRSG